LNGDKDFTVYADKQITPTMEAFADFLIDEVYDGELPDEMDEDTFRRGVALGGSIRMDFQRSDFWAGDSRNRKNRVEEDEPEEVAPARPRANARRQAAAAAPATRSGRRGRQAVEPGPPEDDDIEAEEPEDEVEDNEPEPEPTPARRSGKPRRGAAAPAKAETDSTPRARRSGRRGGSRTAAGDGGDVAAPF
jgi:hypothetical protein